MYDFEIKMRKMIIDLLQPSIEKMSKDKDIQANMLRTQADFLTRMEAIEEAVYNQGRADPIFDQFRVKIAENEKERKMDNEELQHRMQNVETLVNSHNFTIEQVLKEFKMVVSCKYLVH